MNAKEFLKQPKKLDLMIKNKQIEIEQWKAIATGITAQMGGERVQSSGSQQKMADAIDKYVDMETHLTKTINAMMLKKMEVIEVIEQLNPVQYDVLHMIYVQYLTYSQVANHYGKREGWVATIHGRALVNVQKILDEREGKKNGRD